MKAVTWFFLSLVFCAQASAVVLPYTFSTTLPPSQINANFSALRDAQNSHEALRNGHNTRLEDVTTINSSVGTHPINFNDKELFSARVENLSSDPTCAAGVLGKVIWNTTDHLMKVCNGSSFVSIAGSGVNTLASVLGAGNSASSYNIDFNHNQLLNAKVENVVTAPSPGHVGRLVFDTSDSTLKVDTGSVIQAVGGAQGLSSVLGVSNSAGSTNIDFNGNQALKLRGEQLASNPGTSYAGRLYYNTVSNIFKFYNGASWLEIGNTNGIAQVLALGNATGGLGIDFGGGQLLNAKIHNNAGSPSSGVPGQIWFDTNTGFMSFGTSGSNQAVASLDQVQTLTNKTISGSANTLTNIPDGALSSNVVLKTGSQTISGTKTFSAAPVVSSIGTPSGATHILTDGLTNDTITLNNAAQTLAGKTLASPTLSGNMDFASNQAVAMKLENRTADPANSSGRLYYNTNTGEMRYSTGSSWRVLTSNVAGSSIALTDLSAVAPLVYNNTTGVFSIPLATSAVDGYMSATDRAAFAAKVSSLTVASANGFAGSFSAGTTPALTISTSITGLLKGNGTAISAAAAGTDYVAATSGSAIQKANGAGGLAAAVSGTDYQAPISTSGAVANQFVTAFTAPNTFSRAQPAFTDISGVASAAQIPNPSASTLGGVQSIAAGTNKLVSAISTSGVPAQKTLVAGTNMTLTDSGTTITLDAAGGGGGSGVALSQPYAISSHGFAVGDVLRCSSPTVCAKAKADADSTSEALGMVATVPTSGTFTLSQIGYNTFAGITDDASAALVANKIYYLSPTVAGKLTATEPTTVGQVSKPMFFTDAATTGYVLQMRGQVVTGAVSSTTQYIFQGYHDNTCSWSTTSTSYVNPTDDGSCGFTTLLNDGMGTVTSVGSKGPGITIASAPRTGTVKVCATFVAGVPASNSYGIAMVDASNSILNYAPTNFGLNAYATGMVCAIQAVTGGAAYSYKLQIKVSGGTGQIDSNGYNPAIIWDGYYLK